MSETSNETSLKELGNSNYEIAEGEFDIRGWMVKNDRGKIIGKVNDLIFDTQARKVKYLILDLDSNELYLQNRMVLLPLEHATFDEVYRNVIFPGSMANELCSLPTYEKGRITSKMEELIANAFHSLAHGGRNMYDSSYAENDTKATANRTESFSSHVRQASENGPTKTPEHEHMRKHASIGIYEYTSEAQAAVAYLADSGFDRENIEISYREREDIERGDVKENEGVSGFFNRLFNSDESEWLHSEEGRRYTVVAVRNLSLAEAERAAEILDRHGALNIDEHYKRYRENALHGHHHTADTTQRYRSRILHEDADRRGTGWS